MQNREIAIAAAFSILVAGGCGIWSFILRSAARGQSPVTREPHDPVSWTLWDVLVLILFWPWIEAVAVRLLAGRAALDGEFSTSLMAASMSGRLVWVLVAVIYLEIRTGLRPSEFGFDTSRLGKDVCLGVATFLAAVLPVYAIQFAISKWFTPSVHPLAKLVSEHPSKALLTLAALSAMVVAPLAEELLFRVILQGWLQRQSSSARPRGAFGATVVRALPILLSSALFAAVHQGFDRVALFVLAIFLGYLYQQTHRIFASLVLHVCVNSLAIVGLWFASP